MTNPTRTCGDCSACCYTHTIEELEKYNFSRCFHQKPTGGCAIYGDHPDSCREFRCAWLNGLVGEEHERPDKLGLVVTGKSVRFSASDPAIMLLFEAWPGAAREPQALAFMHEQMRKAIAICVVSPTTTPRWWYHLYRLPETEVFGERLVDRNYAVLWHEPTQQKGHPPG